MKDRPILFSPEMVRAILQGHKTQTRRVIQIPRRGAFVLLDYDGKGWWPYQSDDGEISICNDGNEYSMACPYGLPGDWLWVRETHYLYGHWTNRDTGLTKAGKPRWKFICKKDKGVLFPGDKLPPINAMATEKIRTSKTDVGWFKRPSIHMPRWASRILLEITDIRVERLNDISGDDALAEGVDNGSSNKLMGQRWENMQRMAFEELWKGINGSGSWEKNPWVWVVEFKRL